MASPRSSASALPIRVSPAGGLRDHLIDNAEAVQVDRGELQRAQPRPRSRADPLDFQRIAAQPSGEITE